jgi:uncharacterized protein (TIGR02145 family)
MTNKSSALLLLIICISLKSTAQISSSITEKVKDIDGNIYKTVKIGDQVWMSENLKATKFNDGTSIALITDNKSWEAAQKPAYCWNMNNSANKAIYGALYNWLTVSTNKLCPQGWHVPSDDEWSQLINLLGSVPEAGGKLKETGTIHWSSPNTDATNTSGFTALPGGNRNINGTFEDVGKYCGWWSSDKSTDLENNSSWWGVSYNYGSSISSITDMKVGYSIRCIKGNSINPQTELQENSNTEVTANQKSSSVQTEKPSKNTFIDTRDGKTYKTTAIGNQIWMAENLGFQGVPYSTVNSEYTKKFGVAYSYPIAQNVCPTGWHLPSPNEWEKMFVQVNKNASKIVENGGRYTRWYKIADYLINKEEFKWIYTFSNSHVAQFETDTTSEFNILATGTISNPSTPTRPVSQTKFWTSKDNSGYYKYIYIYADEYPRGTGYRYFLDISDGGVEGDSFFVRCLKNQ